MKFFTLVFVITVVIISYYNFAISHAFHLPAPNAPLLDVPTYSLATLSADGKTGMNILTYATPVSAKPARMWAISLFKGTLSHENFLREKTGVLQLLCPHHTKLVKLLGGRTGKDSTVDKAKECSNLGYSWSPYRGEYIGKSPELLPDCAIYIRIRLEGNTIDAGSHDIAICEVVEMFLADSSVATDNHLETVEDSRSSDIVPYLSTAYLRRLGIISEQGRVI
jgi:flavin reductase (DIM6/NTAB) family NADH-FMN oxidoreductase RutF